MNKTLVRFVSVLSIVVFLFFQKDAFSSVTDSLRNLLHTQTGAEKVGTLNELCFQYAYVNTEQAKAFGREAVQISTGLDNKKLLAQSYNDWSIPFIVEGDYEKAIELNKSALSLRIELGDSSGVGSSCSKIASSYLEMGSLDKAISYFQRALAIFQSGGEKQKEIVVTNDLGLIHYKSANYDDALEYWSDALELNRDIKDLKMQLMLEGNIATVYERRGLLTTAEKLFLELLKKVDENTSADILTSIYQGIGVVYRKKGEHQKGLDFYKKALELVEKMNAKSSTASLKVNIGLSYVSLKDFEQAEKYLKEGVSICKETKSYSQMVHAYKGLSELYHATGKDDESYKNFYLALQYKDSMFNNNVSTQFAGMKIRYQTEKKEKEIALKKAELAQKQTELAQAQLKVKQRNLLLFMSISALLLLFAIGSWYMNRLRIKRKQAELDAERKIGEERLRISRDLHDNIGAELTLISSSLDNKAYKTSDEIVKKDYLQISSYARNAMQQLRETIWAIRHENVSVEQLLARFMEFSGRINAKDVIVKTDSTILKEHTLKPTQTLNIFRIYQEALNNAVKYSGAKTIEVSVSSWESSIEILVKDDGKGFDVSSSVDGYGIQNMQSRAAEINSQLKIESEPGKGCAVKLKINTI